MKTINTLILCFFIFSLQAQDYYYNGGEKVSIDKSETSYISFDDLTSKKSVTNGFQKVEAFTVKGFTILNQKKSNFSIQKFQDNNLNQTTPALMLQNDENFLLYPTKTIRVKLKPNSKITDIEKLLDNNNIVKTEGKYGVIKIEVKNIHKVIEIANKIYEAGISEYSIPDFYIPIQLNQVNDPLFPLQYQMHNTGQVIDGIAGVEDIDCNALEAWDISLGDNVTVAIIDQGLEAHEDIGDRLIGGFSPGINGDGTPLANDATHGMNCAGVVGASDNNLGVRGVAPNVNFLSVNIFDGSTTGDIADGIQWALDNGADILSNSWSFTNVPCDFTNIDIENALQNAVDNGRNGDGAVVVFSSGNTGGCVEYPARNPNVISVGAIDNRGNLYNYSSRGAELDLVAPSGYRFGDVGIRTIDRMGGAGDYAGNYRPNFDGTSASCPVVSGAAALVLSINPNLTQQEVRDILTSTATDMGAGGFDNNFGFGRVNSFAAVQAAQQFNQAELEDIDILCYNDSKTIQLNNNQNNPVTWQVSSNVVILSSDNSSVTVRASSSNSTGNGWVKATLSNGIILQEDFEVGIPNISNYDITNASNGGTYILNNRVWNRMDISLNKVLAYNLNWAVTATNSLISHSGTQPKFNINPNQNYGYIQIGIKAENQCGCSQWKWKTFSVDEASDGDVGGIIHPE